MISHALKLEFLILQVSQKDVLQNNFTFKNADKIVGSSAVTVKRSEGTNIYKLYGLQAAKRLNIHTYYVLVMSRMRKPAKNL